MKELFNAALLVSGVCALLATVPGSLEILLVAIGAMRKSRRPVTTGPNEMRLAVVIPAHNETALIGRCVESVAASARHAENCQIVVVADNCTDDTAARAVAAGARVLVRKNDEFRGKGYALRLAFDTLQTEGFDAFLVVDADSIVSPNTLSEVSYWLGAGASVVQCRYRVSNDSASIRTRLMDLAFLAFNVLRPKGRSGLGLSCGILGNGFAVRRDTLQRVPYEASSIVEDLEYHLRLVAAGERVDFIDEASVFGEIPAGGEAARVQRSRWEGGRLRMMREWAPTLAAGILRKKWRLTEPLLDLLMFPLAYHVLLLLFACIVLPEPVRAWAAVALGLVGVHVLQASIMGGQPLKTVVALAAAPFYVLWKMTTLVAVLSASRRNAGWVRTGRENEAGLRPVK